MTATIEELEKRKKAAQDELARQKLEAEVKALERQTKKPGLAVGVLKAYVKMGKMAVNGVGAMVDALNEPPKDKKGKKGKKPE